MATSPLLGFDEMAVNQANKYLTFNEAVKLLEATSHRVISRTTSAQPGSPNDGDAYILPSSPTGSDWASFSQNDLVVYRGTEWVRVSPFEGLGGLWVNDENVAVTYDSSSWVNVALVSVLGGGALTAGAVPFVNSTTDGLAFDTSNLIWDDTNNLLGIGTATPSAIIHAVASGSPTMLLEDSTNTVQAAIRATNTVAQLGSNSNHGLDIITNNTAQLSIDTSGDIDLLTAQQKINWSAGEAIFNSINHFYFNMDSDNNGASSTFTIATNRTGTSGGTELMSLTEAGLLTLENDGVRLNGGSDTLDTYEEGTWTPVIADASSGGNTASFTNTLASYTRIGRQVTVNFQFSSIDTTGMTGANDLYIRGLPFTNDTNIKSAGSFRADNITLTGVNFNFQVDGSSTYFRIIETNSGSGVAVVTVSDLTSGSAQILGSLTYYV